MRCSGLADVENDVFDSVLKQERRLMSCSGPAYAEKAGFRSPPQVRSTPSGRIGKI